MGVVSKIRSIATEKSVVVRLNSWKEIAAYLDRDPRTVQLWEKNEGLPVHRITHQARSTVYAYAAEIDAWVRERSGEIGIAGPAAVSAMATPSKRKMPWLPIFSVLLLVVCGCFAYWAWNRGRWVLVRPAIAPVTLAVLPFDSQTSSDDPLAEGLAEDVASDLGQTARLQVVSRDVRGRSDQPTLTEATARLHASLILRGTVAQMPDQVSVTVELMNVAEDKHVWGKTYALNSAEAPRSEDELAATIAGDVSEKIFGVPLPVREEPKSSDPRAVQAYLEGRFFWNQRDLANLERALGSFQKAIAIDPRFALAYAALAETYDLMPDHGAISDEEAFRLAKQNAHAALDRDAKCAEAYNALAFATYRQDWNFAAAEVYFRKAIQLDPSYAVAHQWYGEFLGDLRRYDESLAELRRANQLTPLSPMVGSDLADGYMHAGRSREAVDELKRILDMYPNFVPAHMYLTSVYTQMQDLSAAEAEAEMYAKVSRDRSPVQWVRVRQLMAAGAIPEARGEAARLMKGRNGVALGPYWGAQLYFLTGQKELGYGALEEAFRQHSWWLVTMLVDPGFSNVREESRFVAVARRVGLPVANVHAAPAKTSPAKRR